MIIQQLKRTEQIIVPHPGTNKRDRNIRKKKVEKELPLFNKKLAFLTKRHKELDEKLKDKPDNEKLKNELKKVITKILKCKESLNNLVGNQ